MTNIMEDGTSSWKKVAPDYIACLRGGPKVSRDTLRYKVLLPTLFEILGDLKGQTVLDAGCGEGYVTRQMVDRGAREVVGVDILEEMIKEARRNNRGYEDKVSYIVTDLRTTLPFKRVRWFDVVLLNMVLHNVDDADAVFQNLRGVLRAGSRLVLSILHPCFEFEQGHRQRLHQLDSGEGEMVFEVTQAYSKPHHFPRGCFWSDRKKLRHYHRPLEYYLNLLGQHGFSCDGVREPLLSRRQTRAGRSDYHATLIPRFVFFEGRYLNASG